MNLKLASLNCRRLNKVDDPLKQQHFIRFLHSCELHLLALQGTQNRDSTQEGIINMRFQAHDTCWTCYCGLVSFHPSLLLSRLLSTRDGRGLPVRVAHSARVFEPFDLLILYPPLDSVPALNSFLIFFKPPFSRLTHPRRSAVYFSATLIIPILLQIPRFLALHKLGESYLLLIFSTAFLLIRHPTCLTSAAARLPHPLTSLFLRQRLFLLALRLLLPLSTLLGPIMHHYR